MVMDNKSFIAFRHEPSSRRVGQEILNEYLGHGWIFQQDSDAKDMSTFTQKWLNDYRIKLLTWSSQSPDLIPIEKNMERTE